MATSASKRPLLIALVLTLLGNGCDRMVELKPAEFPDSVTLEVYHGAELVTSATVDSHDDGFSRLRAWYLRNLSEWQRDFNTYAPSIVFRSPTFTANLLPQSRLIVVNCMCDRGEWVQVSKRLSEQDMLTLGFGSP